MRKLSLVITCIIFSGCAIPTTIKSKPQGATVYIDNKAVGKTPLTYSDTEIILSQKNIRLEMDGYKPTVSVLRKDKLKIGPLVGACFVGVPALWMLGYEEEYLFALERGHASLPKKEVIRESFPEDAPGRIQTRSDEKKPEVSPAAPAGSSNVGPKIIISNNTKLRKQPSMEAKVLSTLKKGTKVQVIKQQDEWCLIEISGGETGWCQVKSLAQR